MCALSHQPNSPTFQRPLSGVKSPSGKWSPSTEVFHQQPQGLGGEPQRKDCFAPPGKGVHGCTP